jgi:glycosyltransferase involved in cell wall biosynthesis
MMDRLERSLQTREQLEEYAEVLLEKVESTRFPSGYAQPPRSSCRQARIGANQGLVDRRKRGQGSAVCGSVAVVIPCFNDGGTVEAAVASAQSQDLPAEIIVVDDGTTDSATLAALERLEAAGVRIIHQANQGPAPARMAGVRATNADYVFALDADDLLATGGLRRLRDVLDRHPEAAAAWGSVRSFGAVEYSGDRSRPSLDPWQVTYQNHLPLSSLYRRSALIDAGGWQLPGGYEDWDLWMSFAERGWKGIGIPEVTAHYRVESGRRLSRSSRRHAERCAKLRARHPTLFAERRRNWRSSPAPLLLKLALPAIEALPFSPTRKRLLGSAISHIAYRNGWGMLVARYRAHRVLRGA